MKEQIEEWFEENPDVDWEVTSWTHRLQRSRTLYRGRTAYQEIDIFENPFFGRCLVLDGLIQTTEKDNHPYHEMLVHVPLLTHGAVEDVLVIGGGDGGVLRELLKYPNVTATLVEIDEDVISLCREYMPSLSQGAFSSPRVQVHIADGFRFLESTDARFDVIIVDSTDPVGSGESLFTDAFYQACVHALRNPGVLITQMSIPFLYGKLVQAAFARQARHFRDTTLYLTSVPTYIGGPMALGWASNSLSLRRTSLELIRKRFRALRIDTEYYTPDVHQAAFALPASLQRLLAASARG